MLTWTCYDVLNIRFISITHYGMLNMVVETFTCVDYLLKEEEKQP